MIFDRIVLYSIIYRWLYNIRKAIDFVLTGYKSMGAYSTKVARSLSTCAAHMASCKIQ